MNYVGKCECGLPVHEDEDGNLRFSRYCHQYPCHLTDPLMGYAARPAVHRAKRRHRWVETQVQTLRDMGMIK